MHHFRISGYLLVEKCFENTFCPHCLFRCHFFPVSFGCDGRLFVELMAITLPANEMCLDFVTNDGLYLMIHVAQSLIKAGILTCLCVARLLAAICSLPLPQWCDDEWNRLSVLFKLKINNNEPMQVQNILWLPFRVLTKYFEMQVTFHYIISIECHITNQYRRYVHINYHTIYIELSWANE